MKATPRRFLQDAHHLLILHGRYTCTARKPGCERCVIAALCPSSTLKPD
ncbi:MAG: endonuclease, partial [Pseudomonadota bacterium]